jgi:ABC-type uncharacterized transport system substrate-binding protein
VVLGLLTALPAAHTQPAGKVWRIGVLAERPALESAESPRGASFRWGLRALGYVEGQNLAFEWRSSGGQAERFPDLAAELVRLKVDVIVATDNPVIAAAQRATSTIPVVMVLAMAPVRTGFVSSLARPGGNITGVTFQGTDLRGPMSYGARDLDLFQRAASYVDKILRGTQATELPVEQSMKFTLILNLKTAEALGLTIPPSILFQADEVIQ